MWASALLNNRRWRCLKQADAGAKTRDRRRRHGVTKATSYDRKAKQAGMAGLELRRLRELEAESAKRIRLLTDAEFDQAALQNLQLTRRRVDA